MHAKLNLRQNTRNGHPILKIIPMILGLALLIDSSPCEARAYRCTDASGSISYSQTPCSAGQTGGKVHGVNTATATDREACTLVRHFAAESFGKLKGGTEPAVLIGEYGGPGYISPVTLNIINFVSGFRFNTDVSALKVGLMAYNKCSNSGFGKIQTSELPAEILPKHDQMQGTPTPMQFPAQGAPVAGTYTHREAANSNRQQLCQNYAQQLDNVNQAMRRGYDAGSGQRMRQQRQQYEELLQEHCRQ